MSRLVAYQALSENHSNSRQLQKPRERAQNWYAAFKIPDDGYAYFSNEVPGDIVEKILSDLQAKNKSGHKKAISGPWENYQKAEPNSRHTVQFEVKKIVRTLKLAGLIIGSLGGVALLIQGSISILAWVFRGFRG